MVITYKADNLQFSWDGKRTIFSHVSFTLNPGEIFCILGPNGTGKSTLLKCMIDLLDLDDGSVKINGTDIRKMDRQEIAKKVAFVPQGYDVAFPYTVLEYVLMGRAPYISAFGSPTDDDIRIALEAIQEVGVIHLLEKAVNEISGGEHQMALIARALAQNPEMLLLDEPTSHLDFGNQMQILSLIERLRDRGIAIVMTSHFPDHAFIISDLVGIMRDGAFSMIGPAEEIITSEALKETYHIDVRVEYINIAERKVCIPMRNKPGFLYPFENTVQNDIKSFDNENYCQQAVYW